MQIVLFSRFYRFPDFKYLFQEAGKPILEGTKKQKSLGAERNRTWFILLPRCNVTIAPRGSIEAVA